MAGCSMVIIEEKQEKVNREKRVKAVLFTKEQRFFFDAMKKVMGVKTGRQWKIYRCLDTCKDQ